MIASNRPFMQSDKSLLFALPQKAKASLLIRLFYYVEDSAEKLKFTTVIIFNFVP